MRLKKKTFISILKSMQIIYEQLQMRGCNVSSTFTLITEFVDFLPFQIFSASMATRLYVRGFTDDQSYLNEHVYTKNYSPNISNETQSKMKNLMSSPRL